MDSVSHSSPFSDAPLSPKSEDSFNTPFVRPYRPMTSNTILSVILTFGILGSHLAPAQTSSVPAPRAEYEGRIIAQTMHWQGASWLIRHRRDTEEATEHMREELRLKPGMTVCDMGSGNGYHTIPMAKAVGAEGKVYAVEVQNEMIELLKARAEKQGITHIETILGESHDPKLPPNSCDLILLVDVYHEFAHPQQMLEGMRKALKPGGQLVLVEFRAEDDSVPIKPEHKMSKEQINKELTLNGYKLVREFNDLPWQHMMFFGVAE